jgi:hypothetical protein
MASINIGDGLEFKLGSIRGLGCESEFFTFYPLKEVKLPDNEIDPIIVLDGPLDDSSLCVDNYVFIKSY